MSKKNNTMENTIVTIAKLSASEKIRQQCLRHEMFEMDRQNAMQTAMQNGYERGHLEWEAFRGRSKL